MPNRIITSESDWYRLIYESGWMLSISFLMLPIIAKQPYSYWNEWDLHSDIEKTLRNARVPLRHEVTLSPGNKIDFVSRGVGIEVKTSGKPVNVVKQLRRYHATDKVSPIILLTTRADHVTEIPKYWTGGITAVIQLWAYKSDIPKLLRETSRHIH